MYIHIFLNRACLIYIMLFIYTFSGLLSPLVYSLLEKNIPPTVSIPSLSVVSLVVLRYSGLSPVHFGMSIVVILVQHVPNTSFS